MTHYTELGLSNSKEIFAKAVNGGYAIPAFNFNNLEQLQAIVGFTVKNKSEVILEEEVKESKESEEEKTEGNEFTDILKTRIDTLNFSTRTLNALTDANIRTIGGIARKKKEDLLEIDGIGDKGIQEIKKVLGEYNITLK